MSNIDRAAEVIAPYVAHFLDAKHAAEALAADGLLAPEPHVVTSAIKFPSADQVNGASDERMDEIADAFHEFSGAEWSIMGEGIGLGRGGESGTFIEVQCDEWLVRDVDGNLTVLTPAPRATVTREQVREIEYALARHRVGPDRPNVRNADDVALAERILALLNGDSDEKGGA